MVVWRGQVGEAVLVREHGRHHGGVDSVGPHVAGHHGGVRVVSQGVGAVLLGLEQLRVDDPPFSEVSWENLCRGRSYGRADHEFRLLCSEWNRRGSLC